MDRIVLFFLFGASFVAGFVTKHGCTLQIPKRFSQIAMTEGENYEEKKRESNSNPLLGLIDMVKNMDDVMEDFFYKRMGNGETFYGKRKYKPSGRVEGDYQGFGLTDKTKIDMTRQYKEDWLEQKKMREEMSKLKQDFENRK